MEERVKFYGLRDLSIGWYENRIIELIENYSSKSENDWDVNDVLELFNVKKFIDQSVFKDWTEARIKKAKEVSKKVNRLFNEFFTKKEIFDILHNIHLLNAEYYDDFFELLSKVNIHQMVSESDFEIAYKSTKLPIRFLLFWYVFYWTLS